jgi:hypothetical protein
MNLKAIKRTNKGEKLKQLASHYLKFLEDGITWNGVENVCNVYLKHHPIRMDIQNDSNNMDHGFKNSYNCHLKLKWW